MLFRFFCVPGTKAEERAEETERLRLISHTMPVWIETLLLTASMAVSLWIVFLGSYPRRSELFYLLFLPIIWTAVRRGLRGVTAGILALNFAIIVLLRIYPEDNQQLSVVQLLMLVLSLMGLVLGAVISERNRSEHRLAEEEEHIRLLMESTAEAIYGVDLAGACTFCCFSCGPEIFWGSHLLSVIQLVSSERPDRPIRLRSSCGNSEWRVNLR